MTRDEWVKYDHTMGHLDIGNRETSETGLRRSLRFPPTSKDLLDEATRPYFLWWTSATVGDLKAHLAAPDPEEGAYWMGALLPSTCGATRDQLAHS